jgi:hypothetical protein
MLDETLWSKLSEEEKFNELCSRLNKIIIIENGEHELSKTKQAGKLVEIKKTLINEINQIIDIENPL